MSEAALGVNSHIERKQLAASSLSAWGSGIIFFTSLGVGVAVDSVALILDAAASLVIMAGALLTSYSLKRINRPADEEYNFGYHKYEPFTGLLQACLIITTCVVSVKFAVQDIIHAESVHSYTAPVIATFFSGVLGLFIFLKIKSVAKHTNSGMLKVTSFHWFADALLSFCLSCGFFIGLTLERVGYSRAAPYIDPVMAIALAIFLVRMPFRVLLHDVRELLDSVPGEQIQEKIRKVVDIYKPKSFGVSRIRVRKAGPKIFLDICYIVNSNLTIGQVRELANSFEKDLKTHIDNCDVVVYFHSAA